MRIPEIVYLAKSNAGDLDLIDDIRAKIDAYKVEIKEFTSKPKLSSTQQLFENMELEGKSSDAIEKGRVKPYLALYKRSTV